MFYLFFDQNSGEKAIFDNQKALNNFIKDYGIDMYNYDNSFPIRNQDYSITTLTIINPDFKAWNEGEYDEEEDEDE